MEAVQVIRKVEVSVSKEEVLRMLHCSKSCNSYRVVNELYEEIVDEVIEIMDPVILYCFGKIPTGYQGLEEYAEQEVIYSIFSVGSKVAEKSTEAFQQGDPMLGMLISAMADSALFRMDSDLKAALKLECAVRKRGIEKRLEAPEMIPMEIQKLIYEKTEAERIYNMKISSEYMLNPVKSRAVLFVLTRDEAIFQVQHECRFCHNVNCSVRMGKMEV